MKDGTTNWSDDSNGNITQILSPEGTIFHKFDAAGNLTQAVAENATTTTVNYTYDALNRVTRVRV